MVDTAETPSIFDYDSNRLDAEIAKIEGELGKCELVFGVWLQAVAGYALDFSCDGNSKTART